MNVFVTGATGFIGSAVVKELLQAGHEVLGLTRSDQGAAQLQAAGAQVHHGSLEDLASLKAGAAQADGVIHLAFVHSFPGILLAMRKDTQAINALGSALAGTDKPLVVAGAIVGLRPGQTLTEHFIPDYRKVPRKSEPTALAWVNRGVKVSVIRLAPTVHGEGDPGFLTLIVNQAQKHHEAVYVKEGHQRWAAVHRLDAARLFRLALEKGPGGGIYHGVGDPGVAFGEIARAIGKGLDVPAQSRSLWGALRSLGFLGMLAGVDGPATSFLTQASLGWTPTHAGLLEDLESGVYFGQSSKRTASQSQVRSG